MPLHHIRVSSTTDGSNHNCLSHNKSMLVLGAVLVNGPAECSSFNSNRYWGDKVKLCIFTFSFFKHFYISAIINSAGAVFRGTKKKEFSPPNTHVTKVIRIFPHNKSAERRVFQSTAIHGCKSCSSLSQEKGETFFPIPSGKSCLGCGISSPKVFLLN